MVLMESKASDLWTIPSEERDLVYGFAAGDFPHDG